MDLRQWDERYRSESNREDRFPTPLLVETASRLKPGQALDLACGAGRNALWLAAHGWSVTAIDGAGSAIEILQVRARQLGLNVEARVADLEAHEYAIAPNSWDLITICYYLQRDLMEPAKQGVVPGGILLVIVHLAVGGEHHAHRLGPSELKDYFREWEILHYYEGPPNDPAHRRAMAQIVARKPSE